MVILDIIKFNSDYPNSLELTEQNRGTINPPRLFKGAQDQGSELWLLPCTLRILRRAFGYSGTDWCCCFEWISFVLSKF
jgi:hypothetical protein